MKKMMSKVAALIAACAGVAVAVPPNPAPPQSSGPDVVTSGIGSTAFASAPFGEPGGSTPTKNGTVGAITAFSVSTVSCNIGNQRAIWIDTIAPTNRHPVIGTQMYRVSSVNGANQFNMLGLNWLKHGFCALDDVNCHSLTNPPGSGAFADGDCDWLQPFSTDTYSAGLNGQQSNLGPRSEVNPWTGAYPFPYILQGGATGDAIFKRTQIKNADLVNGSGYIIECVYITTDEPPANRYNNYAYRLATVNGNGSTATLGLSGPTQSMQTAIDAWVALESGVRKTQIDPSGAADGRLTLGSKVTQTGPNTWHYEYALHNMNFDAAVRSFSVPVDTNVALSNVGFKDVDYHSGEPYSLTDWTFSNGGGAASWATQTFAQNPNANALRWATAYSFRFDANQPPTRGDITIGLFKTGGSAVISGVEVPSVPPPPLPGPFNLSTPSNGSTVASLTPTLTWTNSPNVLTYTVKIATDAGLTNVINTQGGLGGGAYGVPANILTYNTQYFWGVTAFNNEGSTASTPASFSFLTPPPPCVGDLNSDGFTNVTDLTIFLANFGTSVTPNTNGDFDGNGSVNVADLTIFLANFGCPA